MRISDWSSDVCSSDLRAGGVGQQGELLVVDAVRRHPVQHVAQWTQQHAALERGAIHGRAAAIGDLHGVPVFGAAGFGPQLDRHDHPGLAYVGDQRMTCERRGQLRHRSEEHTSELQSLMRISYAVFCLKKKKYK